jgi:hypothetical protein
MLSNIFVAPVLFVLGIVFLVGVTKMSLVPIIHATHNRATWRRISRYYSVFLVLLALLGVATVAMNPSSVLGLFDPSLVWVGCVSVAIIVIPYAMAVRANRKADLLGEAPVFDTWLLRPPSWRSGKASVASLVRLAIVGMAAIAYVVPAMLAYIMGGILMN